MCCPHYTIRLPVNEFVPSRTQRQTLKRLEKYLEGEMFLKSQYTLVIQVEHSILKRGILIILRRQKKDILRKQDPPKINFVSFLRSCWMIYCRNSSQTKGYPKLEILFSFECDYCVFRLILMLLCTDRTLNRRRSLLLEKCS